MAAPQINLRPRIPIRTNIRQPYDRSLLALADDQTGWHQPDATPINLCLQPSPWPASNRGVLHKSTIEGIDLRMQW